MIRETLKYLSNEKLLDILVQGGSPVLNANLNNVTLSRLTQGGGRATRKLNLKEDVTRWEGEGGNVPAVATPSPAPAPSSSVPPGAPTH